MISKELTIEQLEMVKKFQRFIIKADIPIRPTPLDPKEFNWMLDRFAEEIQETREAYATQDFPGVIDGLIDLIYFAYGGIVKQGCAPRACFEAIHDANMNKKRGTHARRPVESGNDAIKPKDWIDPVKRLKILSDISIDDIEGMLNIPLIMHQVAGLVRQKSVDYNTGAKTFSGEFYDKSKHSAFEIDRSHYFPFGDKSYLQMLQTKLERLKSLNEMKEQGIPPNFENVLDTLKDMIAYIVFYSKYIENEISLDDEGDLEEDFD